jgi:sugar phosphate permease
LGLPAITPALREEFDLTLSGVGVLLAAEWVGLTLALLPWGLLTDRIGERRALGIGLIGCGLILASIALVDSFPLAVVLLALAGAVGASVQSASGRALMHWFAPEQRGLAFGVRQTAVMLGGVIGALALPAIAATAGVDGAFLFIGALCVTGGIVGAIVVRDATRDGVEPEAVPWTLRDARLWTLCGASGTYVATQIALFSFVVLYLHDERGFSERSAAYVLALISALAAAARIGSGRWSDVIGSRIAPLRSIGLAMVLTLGAAAILLGTSTAVVVALLVAGGALSGAWNGLSFTAAAELAGRARSGAAIGFQQTVLSLMGIAVPPAFALLVETTSWRIAFGAAALIPVVGWVMLGRLRV